ncbi:hypothetical protein G9A89_014073 [Geosiphon pyriformis]|nr:hypothetical protein G9A89_014073 [Geosiphon pyriformis]
MLPSKQETQRQTVLYFWNEGIRDSTEIKQRTNIPRSTIYNILKKLEKTGMVEHAGGNGRPRKIKDASRTLGQYLHLPLATPMLTNLHKENRVKWAQEHLNDNWKRTVFSDETAFCLFRNTVERWYKGQRPTRAIPKDRTKIMVFMRKKRAVYEGRVAKYSPIYPNWVSGINETPL